MATKSSRATAVRDFFEKREAALRIADEVTESVFVPNIEEALDGALGTRSAQNTIRDALAKALKDDDTIRDVVKELVATALVDSLSTLKQSIAEAVVEQLKAEKLL